MVGEEVTEPAAKMQWELAQKTTDDALRQGLEVQRAVATT
jgi:hypothetical protein